MFDYDKAYQLLDEKPLEDILEAMDLEPADILKMLYDQGYDIEAQD